MEVSEALDKLDKIDKEVEKQKTLKYNLEGQLEQIKKRLEEKGFYGIEEVEERVEELKRLIAVDKKKIINGYKKLEEEHGDLFESIGIKRAT